MRAKPKYYRACAERCRKLAKANPQADAKAHLLDIARQYDKLAEEAERQN